MEKKILLLILICSTKILGQKIDSVSIFHEKELTKEFFKGKKNQVKIGELHLNDGNKSWGYNYFRKTIWN